jgi:hypothetical protein
LVGVDGGQRGELDATAGCRATAAVGARIGARCRIGRRQLRTLRLDECKALVDLYRTLAEVDPSADRDGDEHMNCADLRLELARDHGPARLDDRFHHSIVAVARGISESIRANPRLGRLLQLAAARDCTAGDDDD